MVGDKPTHNFLNNNKKVSTEVIPKTSYTDWRSSLDLTTQALSRRRFLRSSVVLGAGISSVLTIGACSSSSEPVPEGIENLQASHIKIFQRLAEVLFPVEGTGVKPPSEIPLIENIDTMLGSLEPSMLEDVHGLISLFNVGPYVSGFHLKAFVDLDTAAAIDYIDSWQQGFFIQRAIASTMKKFVYASYWRDESTWPVLEFDGPVSKKWGLPRLGNAPLPIS